MFRLSLYISGSDIQLWKSMSTGRTSPVRKTLHQAIHVRERNVQRLFILLNKLLLADNSVKEVFTG